MISASYKLNFTFPKFTHQKDLKHIADRILIPKMQEGIDQGVDLSGSAFPQNEPATVKAKGHSKVLIGKERRLRASFKSRKEGKTAVIIYLSSLRDKVGKYLQIDGIRAKSGSKHYDFFGISKDMENIAMKYMLKKIEDICKNVK